MRSEHLVFWSQQDFSDKMNVCEWAYNHRQILKQQWNVVHVLEQDSIKIALIIQEMFHHHLSSKSTCQHHSFHNHCQHLNHVHSKPKAQQIGNNIWARTNRLVLEWHIVGKDTRSSPKQLQWEFRAPGTGPPDCWVTVKGISPFVGKEITFGTRENISYKQCCTFHRKNKA